MSDSLLPATVGFTEQHLDIKAALIGRVVEILKAESIQMTHYGISETWDKNTNERIVLKIPGYNLSIDLAATS